MALGHNPDLIRNSGIEEQYDVNNNLVSARYDRVFHVTGATGSAVSIQASCLQYIQGVVPIGTAHPDKSVAKAASYRVQPIEAQDQVFVIVTYVYNKLSNLYPTTYTVEVDGGVQSLETDVEWNATYTTKSPIAVKYYKNWSLNVPTTGLPTIPAKPTGAANTPLTAKGKGIMYQPTGGITITKSINSTKADLLEAAMTTYLGTTNISTWRGKAQGTWLCDSIRTINQPYLGQYLAVLHFSWFKDGVDPYVSYYDNIIGTPPNIWRDPNDATPFDPTTSNGYKRTRSVKPENFDTLLAIL